MRGAASARSNPKRAATPTSASSPDPNALSAQQRSASGSSLASPRLSPSSSSTNLNGGARAEEEKPKALYLCSPFVDAALVKGNFKTIVMLPKYVDIMEWVALNIFDFYNNLNEFYGVIAESCTPQTCPTMSAGRALSYTWVNQDRKSVHLPAPTYIDYVMTWVQNLLDDEATFPTKAGHDFPQNFPTLVKHVYRQLLRVFAHIYHAHFAHLLHLRSEPHFNSLFAHFLAFGREYDLLELKDVKGAGAGAGGAEVGIGALWERWKGMGILKG